MAFPSWDKHGRHFELLEESPIINNPAKKNEGSNLFQDGVDSGVLSSFCKGKTILQAISLFGLMTREGMKLVVALFASLVFACAGLTNGMKRHKSMITLPTVDISSDRVGQNTMLDVLSIGGSIVEALYLVEAISGTGTIPIFLNPWAPMVQSRYVALEDGKGTTNCYDILYSSGFELTPRREIAGSLAL